MAKHKIPDQWDLRADPRYKRQNMERAMRGQIERGLVELFTNSDDSYRDLEEEGKQVSGKIRVEIDRKRRGQPSIVIVGDRASGMNREGMFCKLGTLGSRTSGFERGKARRGLHGRGARDVAAFGTIHFKSIKDGEYNHLMIPHSLKCRFPEPRMKRVTPEIREKLGIPKGNGTVVLIEADSRFKIPKHETLRKDFSRYYSLRDLFAHPKREVMLVDLNTGEEDIFRYRYPVGEVVFNDVVTIPDYPEATVHLTIRIYPTPFEQTGLPYREGILVKSAAAIHDCTYFGLDIEPYAWRFSGELVCEYIDKLIREYDDREDENPDHPSHSSDNPMRILDPLRDGLILEHPFAWALYEKSKEILRTFVEELKATEIPPKRGVTDENLSKKLAVLSKEISKIFEKRMKELEEDIPPGTTDKRTIDKLPIGLHIIPPGEEPIITDQPKTFSIIIKHNERLDESLPVDISSSDNNVNVRVSPVYIKKLLDSGKVGTTTFTAESSTVGAKAFIEASYDGYYNFVSVRIVDRPPPPDVPEGLSFDKTLYHVRFGKEKDAILWLRATTKMDEQVIARIASDHREIIIKGGGRCLLRETDRPNILGGKCIVIGRQLKAKGTLTAQVEGIAPAHANIIVEEREPLSGVNFKFHPVEDDFGRLRYKWDDKDPYLLLIGAKHPSIRKYLGALVDDKYPGIDTSLYHAVLAEVIAEALAFYLLDKRFNREGQGGMLDFASTDAYYHWYFSEFLPITHKIVVGQPKETKG